MDRFMNGKLKSSFFSVLPVTLAVLALDLVLPERMSAPETLAFLLGAFFMVAGMALYSLGSDSALSPIGEYIGNKVTETKKVPLILSAGFVIGFVVTIAEPDLMVLGSQLGEIRTLLIVTIALGVGIFLLFALLRIFLKISLNVAIIALYALVFVFAFLVESDYLPLSFDSGGVTTGPITVPFIMALGAGIAGALGGKDKNADSFGVVAICSIGPVLFVLMISLIYRPAVDSSITVTGYGDFSDVLPALSSTLIGAMKDVALAILPVTALFIIADIFLLKLPRKRFFRITIGLIYTYVGLSLFLTGIGVAFMPTGLSVGERLASFGGERALLFVAAAIGALTVFAEPAVHVLSKQVETLSNGMIKSKTILVSLSVSVVIATTLSFLRIILRIPFHYFIVCGYALAVLLSFFTPKVYTAIAFDSGGVASGPMATSFMLPFAIGAATELIGTEGILGFAYGLVAFIALTPLITIQTLGLAASIKERALPHFDSDAIALYEGDVISLNIAR